MLEKYLVQLLQKRIIVHWTCLMSSCHQKQFYGFSFPKTLHVLQQGQKTYQAFNKNNK